MSGPNNQPGTAGFTVAYSELNQPTQQAPLSTANGQTTDVLMKILIELQVISHLLSQNGGALEDLSIMRRDIAASIFS